MTSNTYTAISKPILHGQGGVIETSFSDSTNLTYIALELRVLTAGTVKVTGADDVAVEFLAADIVAMNNVIPFAVKRIWSTGTSATRFLAIV